MQKFLLDLCVMLKRLFQRLACIAVLLESGECVCKGGVARGGFGRHSLGIYKESSCTTKV
jgi:hypothetical protein